MPIIRPEHPTDRAAIDDLLRAAFGGEGEVGIVDRLQQDGDMVFTLVATEGKTITGYIAMSRLPTVMDGRAVRALALAPVAVLSAHQGQGLGGVLIKAALQHAVTEGWAAVVLLGHPDYYPRFGFSAELAARLDAPFHGPAFMALELVPGALDGQRGAVTYPPAFS